MQKQKEQFFKLQSAFKEKDPFYLETLFYAITPAPMQGCLDLALLSELTRAFFEVLSKKGVGASYQFDVKKEIAGRGLLFFLKTTKEKLAQTLFRELEEALVDSLEHVITSFQVGEEHFLGFLLLSSNKKKRAKLEACIEKVLIKFRSPPRVLTLPMCSLPMSLDPHIGIDRQGRIVQHALFEGLTRLGAHGRWELALAQKIEISPCQREYHFHLRSSFWSNGEKITAKDFVEAWQRAINPAFNALCAEAFLCLNNGEKVRAKKLPLSALGVSALSDTTLKVVLEKPLPYFLNLVASTFFVPLYRGQEQQRGDICNGPFKKESVSDHERLVLSKNSHYWDSASVKLERIEIASVKDPFVQLRLFEKGEIDWAGCPFRHLSPFELSRLKAKINCKPVNQVFLFQCSKFHPLLKEPKVRQALSWALDRREIVQIFQGLVRATGSILPLYNLELFCTHQDRVEAKRLFSGVLSARGEKANDLPPIVLSYSDIPGQKEVAMIAASQWEEVLGLKLTLQELSMNTFFSRLIAGELEVGGFLWEGLVEDPIGTLENYNTIAWGWPPTHAEEKEYKLLVNQALQEPTGKKQDKIIKEAVSYFLKTRGIIPVYAESFKFVKKRDLKGVKVQTTGQIDLKEAYLDENHLLHQ